jgi:hypothetical protein
MRTDGIITDVIVAVSRQECCVTTQGHNLHATLTLSLVTVVTLCARAALA